MENEDEYANMVAEENMNSGTGDHRNTQEDEGKREREREEENENMRDIRIRFMENLYKLKKNANKVLENHLGNTDDM